MEANDTHRQQHRKPSWLKVPAPSGETFVRLKNMRKNLRLATVCEEARCPNIGECWASGTATFMVMGEVCTRKCRFCNVKTGNPKGWLDHDEPRKLAKAVAAMELSYVVLTMVDRDDLEDQGAAHVNACVDHVLNACPDLKVELLAGDFRADEDLIGALARGKSHVLAHNVETVERLTRTVRDAKCGYRQSLRTLELFKKLAPTRLTKSSIMLGLGETDDELRQTLADLRAVEVDIVTLGQYLQPSPRHLPVVEYVAPEIFHSWRLVAEEMGFLFCASGPLVRSSYKAGELFTEQYLRKQDATATGGCANA
jgi:lipoic acid synthetase